MELCNERVRKIIGYGNNSKELFNVTRLGNAYTTRIAGSAGQ